MYDRRTVLGLGGAALTGWLAGCSGAVTRAGGGDGPTVEMTDGLDFVPETVTVDVGETVEWVTTGAVAHSVTAYEADLPDGATYFASGGFESEAAARQSYPAGSVAAEETYSHTFQTPGTHRYFCVPHESGMVGTVVVED